MWDTIVEPFAGSGAFSQHWRHDRDVILVDRDERLIDLWHTVQNMSVNDLNALPTPVAGEYYDGVMDQLIKCAAASNGTGRMAGPLKCPARVERVWGGMIRRMVRRVNDCRKWTILCGDYTLASDYVQEKYWGGARFCWFIDPPYAPQVKTTKTWFPMGEGYRGDAIDYGALAEWCKTLRGQVIVCEREGADWLNFVPLKAHHDSQGKMAQEVVATWET